MDYRGQHGVRSGDDAAETKPRPSYTFTIPTVSPSYRYIGLVMVSPDGRRIAFRAAGSDGVVHLWVQSLDSFEVRKLEATRFAASCAGRHSKSIVFTASGGLARVSADGGASQPTGKVEGKADPYPGPGRARQISTRGAKRFALWSRDGKTLYFATITKVFRVAIDPATGEPLGEPQLMFELPYEMGNWDVAPDGTFVMALATEERNAPPLRVVTDWRRLFRD